MHGDTRIMLVQREISGIFLPTTELAEVVITRVTTQDPMRMGTKRKAIAGAELKAKAIVKAAAAAGVAAV